MRSDLFLKGHGLMADWARWCADVRGTGAR
jgi:hypothetical protein